MDELELRAWLRFSRLEISPAVGRALVDCFGSPQAVFDAAESDLRRIDRVTDNVVAKILGPVPAAIENDLKLIERLNVTLLPISSEDYPPNLKHIYDPPVLLYVRGRLLESDKMSIAIVGSRRAGEYGLSIARKLARDLASKGLAIVSGGARGIDTAAHQGALEAGGRTVAFLGSGIDVNYPPENRRLF
ncbi:MAG: DNA-processing protein DprA, partial [Armatimonadota bacterium]|nr:DNA-processing protein DprA [Armatimonadota bacterium]